MKQDNDKYIHHDKKYNGTQYYRLVMPFDGKFCYVKNSKDKNFLRILRDRIIRENLSLDDAHLLALSMKQRLGLKHIQRYTTRSGNQMYMIHRKYKGRTIHYGSYDSLDEAMCVRDCLVSNDWDESVCPVSVKRRGPRNPLNRYISCDKWGVYTVAKNFPCGDGYRRVVFESGIRSLDEARRLRDWWVEHDWDWSSIDLV